LGSTRVRQIGVTSKSVFYRYRHGKNKIVLTDHEDGYYTKVKATISQLRGTEEEKSSVGVGIK
jgi:hypothetical protein